ncbi:hypothetical protein Y032_0118g767 [Ancylostoma ceylanicum]|nr:hypothetical protein Y032_0118g767 [Ancylostoma ceylanicum]
MLLIILSLAIPGSCMNYSHYLARNISLTLCDAAYMSNPSDSLRSKLSASDVQGFYAELDGGSCSGLIVTLPKRNIVALAFRAELYEPFYFDNWNKFYFPMRRWNHEGNVSKFLVDGFRKLWRGRELTAAERMRNQFRKALNKLQNGTVLITGHYVGGGLAALVALDIVKEEIVNKDDVILITLAQIMAGDKDFVEAYEKQVVKSYRVITKGDLIPHVPGKKHGYEYNGKEVYYKRFGSVSKGKKIRYKLCYHDNCSRKQFEPVSSEENAVYSKITRYGLLRFGVLA